MHTIQITQSSSVAEAADQFLAQMKNWVDECIIRYADAPATNVHDQGTFTTGWESYLHTTSDVRPLAFLKSLRDKIHSHFIDTDQWQHGYWRMQEAHHGTEHYELFLGMLWRLDSTDATTIAQIVDVAEHLGNWSSAVVPWFDWDRGLYRSFLFGTDGVQMVEGAELNVPDHLRCSNIALLAHRATGEERYLELATTQVERWATALLAEEELPIGLLPDRVVYRFAPAEEAVYRARVGQSSQLLTPIDRAESFLASDAINSLLYLWQATGTVIFRQAAERLLDTLLPTLCDPDAGAVADALRHYRRWTHDSRYDQAVCAAVASSGTDRAETLAFDLTQRMGHRPAGVGKREDMLLWQTDGQPRRQSPITLGLAAELTNDVPLATFALDLASAHFQLAQQTLPDGRDHGCAARTVSAVVRGHGRENHAGMTTAVLGPLSQHFYPS